MAIRIIVRTDDASMLAAVGGSVYSSYRTFIIDAPEVEAFLSEPHNQGWSYTQRSIVGVEAGRHMED